METRISLMMKCTVQPPQHRFLAQCRAASRGCAVHSTISVRDDSRLRAVSITRAMKRFWQYILIAAGLLLFPGGYGSKSGGNSLVPFTLGSGGGRT